MSLALFVSPKWSFQDDNGGNASGWKLYTYEPGTSTPKAAYQDSAGTTPHANPIVLDARGEAEIWLDGAYKFVLKNAAGVTKWTADDITGYGSGVQTGYLTKSVAGSANVALTASEQSNAVIEFTGELTGNINVTVGDDKDGYRWTLINSTTGSFTLTFKTTSGTGAAIDQGAEAVVYHDGTNIVHDQAGQRAGLGSTTVGDAVFTAATKSAAVEAIFGSSQIAFRNVLINGEVTRINQRGFDGNWAAKSVGDYGYDRWKKASDTEISQVVEEGNFKPSTVYTLSGNGVTTQQLTSPASGHWTITVPNTATNVQLEEGLVATPFEKRNMGAELAMCQRYFEKVLLSRFAGVSFTQNMDARAYVPFAATKRAAPTCSTSGNLNVIAVGTAGEVINVDIGTPVFGATVTGLALESIPNNGAMSAAGGVVSWASNGPVTVYADAEL